MRISAFSVVAAVVLLYDFVPPVFARHGGRVHVISSCSSVPVATWFVYDSERVSKPEKLVSLPHSEAYKADVGTSINITIENVTYPGAANVNQFEFTYNTTEGKVYYDDSDIDGHGLNAYGLEVTLELDECNPIKCPPGKGKCTESYNHPTNDTKTRACDGYGDLTVKLFTNGCPGNCTANTLNGTYYLSNSTAAFSCNGTLLMNRTASRNKTGSMKKINREAPVYSMGFRLMAEKSAATRFTPFASTSVLLALIAAGGLVL